ncbi:MAG: hypothetical protein K8R53_08515 [Bacteroidales bacterium]|nr:hypothetical protein [Bacteroidales bacterium]
MNYKIVKLSDFSGNEANIYSIFLHEEQKTLFDIFIEENLNSFKSELKDIFQRLTVIGKDTGARESYFKIFEGEPGDGICALYDKPGKSLRLYCIRYGSSMMIIGGGGPKSKNIKALQEDEKLFSENKILRQIVKDIINKVELGEIEFSDDGKEFLGNLQFSEYEED